MTGAMSDSVIATVAHCDDMAKAAGGRRSHGRRHQPHCDDQLLSCPEQPVTIHAMATPPRDAVPPFSVRTIITARWEVITN